MGVRLSLLFVLAALTAALALPGGAAAAICGRKDPKTHKVVTGELEPDGSSTTTVAFRRSTHPRSMLLLFSVRGCTLARKGLHPGFVVDPSNEPADDIVADALKVEKWNY